MVFVCYIFVLMRVLNVHIENITITIHILSIQSKIIHKLVNKKINRLFNPPVTISLSDRPGHFFDQVFDLVRQ